MPDQDVNTEAVVTPTGVVEQPATAPETSVSQVATDDGVQQTGDVTHDTAAAPAEQQAEQGPVPYDRFKEVNDAKNELTDTNQRLEEHIRLLGTQQPQRVDQPQGQQPESLTLQVMKQAGIDPDIATPMEMLQVFDTVSQIRAQQATTQNQVQQFIAANADFTDVVGTTDAQGRFTAAPPLLRAIQKDPQLTADLQAAGVGANRLAYRIAVTDAIYQQELADKNKPAPQVTGETAEQAIKAAASLTSLSSVGTSGVIDKSAQFAAMTDEQIKAHAEAVMRKGGVAIG